MKLVQIADLEEGMVLAVDIFTPDVIGIPLVRKDSILNRELIEEIERRGIQTTHIKEDREIRQTLDTETRASDKEYDLSRLITKPVPALSPQLQARALDSLEDFFQQATLSREGTRESSFQMTRNVGRTVSQLVDALLRHRGTLVNINDLKSFDEFIYHHSLSVAVLSIAIAQQLKLDKEEQNRIGLCAMVHDIGKIAMPLEIIHKTTPLSDEEFALMKGHSVAGYDYLKKNRIGDEELWKAVLFHHEKIDGTGYPMGITGQDIPFISKIISIADVYDALTSNRPHRKTLQPFEAVEYIMGGAGSAFDYDIVLAFIKKLEIYPLASLVELSTGDLAEVIDNENSMRPVVRLLDRGEILDLYGDYKNLNIVITRVLHDFDPPEA